MPRIRTIKPSFFKSDDVSVLPLRARLTWIGLWTQCDDQGRTKDHARLIKADIWPLDDVSLADIESDLETLAAHGRIVRYEVGGQRYLEVVNWNEHQSINRPTLSRIPPPPPLNGHGPISEPAGSPHAGKGREGKGREGTRDARASKAPLATANSPPAGLAPPRKCEKHLQTRNPPKCGDCADARRAAEAWQAERRAAVRSAPKCPRHRGELAANCGPCAAEAKGAA